MREGSALASKRVIATMPERQARMLSQATATPVPTGDTIPIPVITTRRLDMSRSWMGGPAHGRIPLARDDCRAAGA
jgi:hypothetical protein